MEQIIRSGVLHCKKIIIVVGLMLAFTRCVYAVDLTSATGYWETIDDETQQVSSIVQIWQNPNNHMYYGKIYKIFPENGHKTSDVCVNCRGAQKNKPMLGLQIVRDMVYRDGKYHDGYILDPRNGKEYHAQMRLDRDGQLLKLRGYIGLPLFGKTAQWNRATQSVLNK
jgi:uncharacterized protein (DUF2147 family)